LLFVFVRVFISFDLYNKQPTQGQRTTSKHKPMDTKAH